MKFLSLILSVLLTTQSFATTPIVADILIGNKNFRNFMMNPSCDTNTNGIAKTGSAVITRQPQSFGSGIAPYSCQLDGVASGDTITMSAKPMDQYMIGQNCMVSFTYGLRDSISGPAGATWVSAVNYDGLQTPEIQLTTSNSITALSVFPISINIPCGGLTSTGGGAGASAIGRTAPALKFRFATVLGVSRIFFTQGYSGEATNTVQVSSITDLSAATPISIVAVSGGATKGTTTIDSVRWRKVGSYAEIEYRYAQSATTGAATGTGDYLLSLPTGLVMDSSIPLYTGTISALASQASIIGTGGSWDSGPTHQDMYPIAYTNTQFRVRRDILFSAVSFWGSGSGGFGAANSTFTIFVKVPIQGWSSNTSAAAANQTDFGPTNYGALTITGSSVNPVKGTVSIDKAIVERKGQYAYIQYTYQQTASGSGTTGTGEYIFTLPGGLAADTNIITPVGSTLGTSVNATANAKALIGIGGYVADGTSRGPAQCFLVSSTAFSCAITVAFSAYEVLGSTRFPLNSATVAYSFYLKVPISGWAENQRAPTLVGSVTSNSAFALRIESVKLSVTGVVSDESSDWVNGNCAVASGITTCTFNTGIFSSTPTCVAINNNMPGFNDSTQIDGTTATTTTLKITTHRTSTGNVASPYQLMCMGPR